MTSVLWYKINWYHGYNAERKFQDELFAWPFLQTGLGEAGIASIKRWALLFVHTYAAVIYNMYHICSSHPKLMRAVYGGGGHIIHCRLDIQKYIHHLEMYLILVEIFYTYPEVYE